jgi:23S rRNA (guanosine2251-2'-O)-methyltransferase
VGRIVAGIHAVRAALKERPRDVEKLYLREGGAATELGELARRAGVRWHSASTEQLARLSQGESHQGVVAEMADFRYLSLEELLDGLPDGEPPLILLLDGIEDPQNLGAIVRSAQGLGVHGLILPRDRAAGVTPAVARASAGAIESARIAQVVNLSRAIERLKEKGFWLAVADQEAEKTVWETDLTGPLGIVIGAEGKGVRPLVRSHCDLAVRIPMQGQLGSLNASVAAGILLYETRRQRASRR